MLSNIYRKLSERQSVLRRYVFDGNILSTCRNNNEFTHCRCLNTTCKLTKTDKYTINFFSRNVTRFCTNIAAVKESHEEPESLSLQNTEFGDEDIEKLLNLDWSKISSEEFIDNFQKLSFYIKQIQEKPNINFDNLLQGIAELSSKFSIDDLILIFKYTPLWKGKGNELDDIKKKIANSLDEELIKRFPEINLSDLFFFCYSYNRITFGKKVRFVKKAIFKIDKKVKQLSSQEISRFMNILTYSRYLPLNFYLIEHRIQDKWEMFTHQEIHNILKGFLLNDYRIRNKDTRVRIYGIISNNIKEMKPDYISSILQYLTLIYRVNDEVDDVIKKILQSLETRLDEFKLRTWTSILALAAHVTIDEKTLIASILERVNKEMQYITITDIERISCSMSVFNYDPHHPFYTNVLKELYNPDRQEEISQHNRAFLRTLQSLIYVNIYPTDLISKIMDSEFIEKNYRNPYVMKSSYFFIDQSLKAECPSYAGHVLSEKLRTFFSKKNKSHEIIELADLSKITQEVVKICERIFNIPIYVDKVLPHFFNADIVFCYDENDNPISPEPFLSPLENGEIKRIPEEAKKYKWLILIITSSNMLLKNSGKYSGILDIKCRQLKALGYTPVVISHNEWYLKKNDEQCEKYREDYVKKLLSIK